MTCGVSEPSWNARPPTPPPPGRSRPAAGELNSVDLAHAPVWAWAWTPIARSPGKRRTGVEGYDPGPFTVLCDGTVKKIEDIEGRWSLRYRASTVPGTSATTRSPRLCSPSPSRTHRRSDRTGHRRRAAKFHQSRSRRHLRLHGALRSRRAFAAALARNVGHPRKKM
jgi:hypothetical protein